MQFKTWLEDFEQWNTGKWVHYSHGIPRTPGSKEKIPLIKINYKMRWNDPLGIYFFPEKFENKTQGGWHNYDFKFIVEFPPMKIFDMAKFSQKEFDDILSKNNIAIQRTTAHAPHLTPPNCFWNALENAFLDPKTGGAQKAKMNKFFRSMGYDAIFDDTNSIFAGETQLILLNPAIKYKVVDIQRNVTSGWEEVTQVINHVKQLCKPYGNVTIRRENQKYSGWDNARVVRASVVVNEHLWKTGPYASWTIRTGNFDERLNRKVPNEIWVELSGSQPSIRTTSNSIGVYVSLRDMEMEKLDAILNRTMSEIWEKAKQVA
jgi:hypothetical protein